MTEGRSDEPTETSSRRPLLILAALPALAGIVLVLVLALFGSENQLMACLKDDGYYYLVLARNMATGHGATFDGLGPTNGFHPLWAMCLTPLYFGDPESLFGPVRAMIVLALALHLGAALAIRRAVDRFADSGVATIAALLYVGNPLALYLVVSGMESPVVALTVAMLATASIRLQQGDLRIDKMGDALQVGALCGLCMLTRTEMIMFAGLVLAQAVLWPAVGTVRSWSDRLRGGLAAGLTAIVMVAPWLIWNLWRFGSVIQVSAKAHHLHMESVRGFSQAGGQAGLVGLGNRLLTIHRGSLSERLPLPSEIVAVILVAMLALVVWWLVAMLSPKESRRYFLERLRWLAAPLLYAAGFVAASFLILGNFRSWYAAGPLTVVAIFVAVPLGRALLSLSAPRRGRLVSGLISGFYVLGMLALGPVFLNEINYEAGKTNCWWEAAEVVATTTAPGERVASFNSGTFGYLAPRQVVNLDCVVNNRALPYLADKRLPDFIEENDILFIIDDPSYVRRYFRAFSEQGWNHYLVAVDTLSTGLVFYEVR
ncbi:MAG: hypothetical protein KAH56_05725 [Candidatus Krumholzibacteria bacterium]|nr:hypothetical protein [Candidatus Krumholzibacteria bacterium]